VARRREVAVTGELRARLIAKLTEVAADYYPKVGVPPGGDPAGWLRKVAALEAHEPVVVAGWECAPTVPATSGWWELQSDDALVELSRADLVRRGWDIPR
jgi:hypothetical protein